MLDHPVRLGLDLVARRDDVARLVELEVRLGALHAEGAARQPGRAQLAGKRPRQGQRLGDRRRRLFGAGKDAVDLPVLEARVGADQAAIEG